MQMDTFWVAPVAGPDGTVAYKRGISALGVSS
jgi:hypothetical protein